MKIVFLCSCLEPGRDGVGDYTRRLAIELVRQGHLATAISLNDNFISQEINNIQQSEGNDLPILRLPASWAMKVKLKHAKKYIDNFNPDWVSLQFVIFGFHPKGLPFGLCSQLSILAAGRKLHLMFHELWVGMNVKSHSKEIFIGSLQKLLIKNLINRLKPGAIHTQTKIYQAQLLKMGFSCGYLPLFSNIPILTKPQIKKKGELNIIKFVNFGATHPGSRIQEFVDELEEYSKRKFVKIIFVFVGRSGMEQLNWISICKLKGFELIILGEQTPERISEVLSDATIGISSNEVSFVEKSGTVASMLEHGLRVICIAQPWMARELPEFVVTPPDGVVQYERGKIENFLNVCKTIEQKSNLETTSKRFVQELKVGVR